MISDAPLTDAEFALLDDFLSGESAPENTMDAAMLDGFLAAVVSAPNLVMPGEWLCWVCDTENGRAAPAFASQAQANQITALLMQHYQYLNHTLTHTPALYRPCIYEREEQGRSTLSIDEWCMGYYIGMALDLPGWAPLLAVEPTWFSTILSYGTQEGEDARNSTQNDPDANQAAAAGLAATACKIHAFWLQQRLAQQASGTLQQPRSRAQPVRTAPKVGRNDACPCGSGKKYKHCHANH